MSTTVMRITAGLILLGYLGGIGAQPPLETGPETQVSDDGLYRVDQSIMDAAWLKPDLDLTPYKKILIMPTGVSFRSMAEMESRTDRSQTQTEFPVADDTKLVFRRVFQESFSEDLAALERYEISSVPGRNVLMVQGFLVDFVSGYPAEQASLVESRLNLRWEATIVLELRDFMSNEILARTVERERMQRLTGADVVVEERRRLMRRWSQLLRTRLVELSEISGK